jgi:hypothetical protein
VGVQEREWAIGVESLEPQGDFGDLDGKIVYVNTVNAVLDHVGSGSAQRDGVGFGVAGAQDRQRCPTAKCRKNYAGTSPLTVASGKKRAVLARHVRNRRLYDAVDQWALCAITNSPGARAFYDQHRAAGDLHHQALRALGNRLVGILHGCLRHHTAYNELTAWAHRQIAAAA